MHMALATHVNGISHSKLRFVCQTSKGRNTTAAVSNSDVNLKTRVAIAFGFLSLMKLKVEKFSSANSCKKAANLRKKMQKAANSKSVSNQFCSHIRFAHTCILL